MNLQPEAAVQDDIDRLRFAGELLDALQQPAALLTIDGLIVKANSALRRRLGSGVEGRDLADLTATDPQDLSKFVRRCAGSREPFLGALRLADGAGFTAHGSLVRLGGEPIVLLRLSEPDERFVRLTQTVRELNLLLRQREHEKAQLNEALSDRQLLHRELQHRVKNNMQMLAGLLHAAKSDQTEESAKAALEAVLQRFATVAAAHQSLYHLDSLRSLPAAPLLSSIAESAAQASGRDIALRMDIRDIQLPNDSATPVALIVNELVTNAAKHARPNGETLEIRVQLACTGDVAQLVVVDNGTGFDEAAPSRRSSGLGLVRGLVRQLRGKLALEHESGTRISVLFPLEKSGAMESDS